MISSVPFEVSQTILFNELFGIPKNINDVIFKDGFINKTSFYLENANQAICEDQNSLGLKDVLDAQQNGSLWLRCRLLLAKCQLHDVSIPDEEGIEPG